MLLCYNKVTNIAFAFSLPLNYIIDKKASKYWMCCNIQTHPVLQNHIWTSNFMFNISENQTRLQCLISPNIQLCNISEKSTRPQCPTCSNTRLTRSSLPPLWRMLPPLEETLFSSLQRGTGQHSDNNKEKDVAKETDTLPQSRLDSKANPLEPLSLEYDYRRLHTNQLLLRLHSPLIAALLNDLPPSPLVPGKSHQYQQSYHHHPHLVQWYKSSLSAFITLSSPSSSSY